MTITNHQLFSHSYLAQLHAAPSHDNAAASIARGLRDRMPGRDTSSLRSLIRSWVGPVLDLLEFHHAPADGDPHIRRLYARRGDESPAGLCYVVSPGRGLDDTTKGRHPMAQAVLALRAQNLRWGMLTDGARWRLVDAHSRHCYEHYVEADLDELARSDDATSLRLFHAFFHRSAFTSRRPRSGAAGEGRLARLAAASARATQATEDHLKARISHNEGIMAQLCLGLVRAAGRAHYTEAERDAIYRDATYLLYRILFILYAEARGLLPLDNPAYRAVSLTGLVERVYACKLRGTPEPPATASGGSVSASGDSVAASGDSVAASGDSVTTLWDRLKQLSATIHEGDPALGVPAYNGSLFDDADKPYLRDGAIADAYLTTALFALTHRPDADAPDGYQPIDYRDLSVRHLGSIYEEMLEYRLQIAEETLWARRAGKGRVRFLRTGQDSAPRKTDVEIGPGRVYFSQSPGERRATGAYYTPGYVVDYIVRQTVGRELKERRASLEEKLAGRLKEIDAATDPDERARLQRAADEELLHFAEQVLSFRVCDPAMGSGHFLVNAAHQMTALIVETLHLTPWENEALDADPVAWRRRVVERCLYGVDLGPMAVELAKLSLWLASAAEGQPLSFLDRHLRQGNGLVCVRLEDPAGQPSIASPAGCEPGPAAAPERRFTSWDLAFPDVYLGPGNRGGFDVVLGNPPYGATLDREERAFLKAALPKSSSGDSAEYFLEQAHRLSGAGQRVGMIVPKSIAFYTAWRGFRRYLVDHATLLQLLDVGIAFDGVNCEQLVIVFKKQPPASDGETRIDVAEPIRRPGEKTIRPMGTVAQALMQREGVLVFRPLDGADRAIIERIIEASHRFEELYQDVFRGLYIPDAQKQKLGPGPYPFVARVPDVRRYEVRDVRRIDLPGKKWREQATRIMVPRIFLKVLRGKRLVANHDSGELLTTEKLVNVTLGESSPYELPFIVAVLNSPAPSFYLQKVLFSETTETSRVMDHPYASSLPIPRIRFTTPPAEREALTAQARRLYAAGLKLHSFSALASFADEQLQRQHAPDPALVEAHNAARLNKGHRLRPGDLVERADVVHDLLAYLARQMMDLHRARQRLERQANLFHFVARDTPCLRLDKALAGPLGDAEMIRQPQDPTAVRHDVEGLRLSRMDDGRWLLQVRARLRDPQSGWRKHLRDRDGKLVRQWLPVYRLPLDEATGRFYHYAFAHRDGFAGAGRFPGGFTRTTLEKVEATKVPAVAPVDLSPLVALEAELTRVRRQIHLTDALIDLIVYKLYGLNEEEGARVEEWARATKCILPH